MLAFAGLYDVGLGHRLPLGEEAAVDTFTIVCHASLLGHDVVALRPSKLFLSGLAAVVIDYVISAVSPQR